ncbi:MAG: hypothetical protein QOI12_831 [Alphaproteobacteria bacterium]|jgi:hypothetical protein|nr:hypothetical protein [Alphaproteobacteria bacterium]
MDNVVRLLLRFIIVPLGYLAAVIAGAFVILFATWHAGAVASFRPAEDAGYAIFGVPLVGPILLVLLAGLMWLPTSIGILISEAFAIRSWMFHAANGAVSAWLGWNMFSDLDQTGVLVHDALRVIAAGLAGGLAYWAVAGWNAGFWRPLLPPPAAQVPAASGSATRR